MNSFMKSALVQILIIQLKEVVTDQTKPNMTFTVFTYRLSGSVKGQTQTDMRALVKIKTSRTKIR